MFKRLLVPLDGSRLSSRALPYATEIARRFGAEVILLRVVAPATPVAAPTGTVPGAASRSMAQMAVQAAMQEERRNAAHARRYLSGKTWAIRSQDIEASYGVRIGDPAQTVRELSQEEHVDLVVMTTHGRSGLKRAIMGSVADAVVRESGRPVLVIRPGAGSIIQEEPMFERILVCLDGSTLAEQILPFVQAQAQHFDSRVVLLQAVRAAKPKESGETPAFTPVVEEVRDAEEYLEQVARRLRAEGIDVGWDTVPVLNGAPSEAITKYVREAEMDLVMLTTHGRSGLKRAVLGSVAGAVVRGSEKPVLVIRPGSEQ